jgi:hypothetical protein
MTLALIHDRSALERAIPLDPMRSLQGSRGDDVAAEIDARLGGLPSRQRALRPKDRERWLATLNMFLANLALAAFNRIDASRFVALSFDGNIYSGTAHSVVHLGKIRDGLAELGLIEGQYGYRHVVDGRVRHSRRTRLRATETLRTLFGKHGLSRRDIGWSERRDSIILRQPNPDITPEPADIRASRAVIEQLNAALGQADIFLPEDAWLRVTSRYRANDDDSEERLVAGEEGTRLYRVFKHDWTSGGRLYGGWWINLPKVERQRLSLGGEAVVDRDYGRLHPTLLFARKRIRLDHDIYAVPGYSGPHVRELGKRTFNRLINRSSQTPLRLVETPEDRAQLPAGVRFRDYVADLARSLEPIVEWFGTGEGLRLQREDSDLALDVLSRLLEAGIIALPVHDSFIVARRHEDHLVAAMEQSFRDRFGFTPEVR